MVVESAQDLLTSLCADLRLLWTQAGGPSLRTLGGQLQVSKSQVGAILNGRIRRPPDWQVVSGLVDGVRRYAVDHGRVDRLSLRTGVDEYWRPRYAMLEHAFGQSRGKGAVQVSQRPHSHGPVVADRRVAAVAPAVVPALLPSAVAGFAGRGDALRTLDTLLADDPEARPAVLITAIEGTAGVGKTALAVYWAHRVADQFPDGQLYVNLRGFDPGGAVLDPAEAVREFLDALGVPPQRIPTSLPAQAGLYRSVLAGKRVLVVLDNARDADQVRPLLPGAAGCLVVVTSRNQLTPLVATEGASPLTLDLLSAEQAREMLIRRVGARRVAGEADAVDEIIARCTRLPLALAIVGARAATRPALPLGSLAAQLRDSGGPLDVLTAGDPATDVRHVFSWSYRTLSADAARLFRLLGLHPGPDINPHAAASLVGLPVRRVLVLLTELTRAHLLVDHTSGRYAFHDLLRAYAIEQADAHDGAALRLAAVHRLLDHYLRTAHGAAMLLHPYWDPVLPAPCPEVVPEQPPDTTAALAWFAAEYRVLLAASAQAARLGFDTHSWQLAWAMSDFLNRRGLWQEQYAVHGTALDAAARLVDVGATAYVHRGLGIAAARLGRPDEAIAHYQHSLRLFTENGDHAGQGMAHINLANLAERQGRLSDALWQSQQALDRYQTAGHGIGHARALNAIGWCHAQLGDHREALTWCERALATLREINDRDGAAHTWDSLAYLHHHLGDHRQAATCYQHALDLHRELGSRLNEAETLARLGDAHYDNDEPEAARTTWQHALTIFEEIAHPDTDTVRERLRSLAR